MKLRYLTVASAVFGWFGPASVLAATDYPAKLIKIVVPYAPGGSSDAFARLVARRLGERLEQPVVVENKPGASEQLAASYVAKSPADGYTFMLMTMNGFAVNPSLYGKTLQYDPVKDLAPIIQAVGLLSVVVVNPKVPAQTLKELTAYLKANPGTLNYGSAGNGTPSHLGMELYKRAAGVEIMHVPYKGGAPATADLMAGQVQVMMAVAAEGMPLVKSGRARALAQTSPIRSTLYPDLPTVSESGVEGFNLDLWYGFAAPAQTPKKVIAKLNTTINEILREREMVATLKEMGMEVIGGSPQDLSDVVKLTTIKWKKVIDEAGITVD